MLLLAGALSLLVLIISFTVIFVALKLFSHFRAVHAQEDEEKQDNANGSNFAGIRKNSTFARLIEKSFTNQTQTLAKTVEEHETFVFQCVYCNVIMVEVKGDWDCSHCGGDMRLSTCQDDQEEDR